MNLTKMALPALLGALVAAVVVAWWVTQIMALSFRTDGMPLSQYAPHYPALEPVQTSTAAWCNPAYKMRWAGCNLK